MDNPNFNKWSREEKEEYSKKRLEEMRLKNKKLEDRHKEVQGDRIVAERRNSAVTNRRRQQQAEGSRSRRLTRNAPVREWDRGKNSNDDWGHTHSHKGFKNYKTGYYERRYNRNDSWPNEEKYFQHRRESNFDKKNRRYDQHSRYHYHNSYIGKTQQFHEKSKRHYYTDSRKKHEKYHSSSSADSEKVDNEVEKSNQETSFVWNNVRLHDDIDKSERTKIWVESIYNSGLETFPCLDQENVSEEEKDNKRSSPKRKCERFETESVKCLDENIQSSKSKSRQISVLKSPKNDYYEIKASTQVSGENNRQDEMVKHSTERRSTKFHEHDHTESSSESYDYSRWCNVPKKKSNKSNEASCTLSSMKHDYNKKGKNYDVKHERKCNLNLNASSKGNKYNSEETSDFANKSSSQDISSHSVEKPHNARYNFDKKIMKKGFKTKRDPQYNSLDGSKIKHYSKQRKFDKFEDYSVMNKHKNLKNEKYDFKNKRDIKDGWNENTRLNNEDGWSDFCDEWISVQQSGHKWNLSDEVDDDKKADCYDNERSVEEFQVKNSAAYDDGDWSTVEEGEVKSDNSEEGREHVKPKYHKKHSS